MGNKYYNLKSNTLRCENCFLMRRLSLEPKLPQSYIILECNCGSSRINIQHFLSELHKGNNYKTQCYKCSKEDNKLSYYNDCNHLLCENCSKEYIKNNSKDNNKKLHKFISSKKFDFYCIEHQNELFFAYCFDCNINFCKICEKEKIHLNHNSCKYDELILKKDEKKSLRQMLKYVELKLDYNTKVTNLLVMKLNKEDMKKKLIKAERDNFKENKNLMELVNFFLYVYDNSKNKNYSIIHNVIKNINFNIKRYTFLQEMKIEIDADLLLRYFGKDLILRKGKEISNIINSKSEKKNSIIDFDEEVEGVNKSMVLNSKYNLNENENNINIEEDDGTKSEKNSIKSNIINNIDKNDKNNENNNYIEVKNNILFPKEDIQNKFKNKNNINDYNKSKSQYQFDIKGKNNINKNEINNFKNNINFKKQK